MLKKYSWSLVQTDLLIKEIWNPVWFFPAWFTFCQILTENLITVYSFDFAQSYFCPIEIWCWFAHLSNFLHTPLYIFNQPSSELAHRSECENKTGGKIFVVYSISCSGTWVKPVLLVSCINGHQFPVQSKVWFINALRRSVSVKYMWLCMLLKKVLLTLRLPGHRRVGFFHVPIQAQTWDHPIYVACA